MNPFATADPAANLPHAVASSADSQRAADDQQKRRAIGVLGVILLVLLAFASSSSPSPSAVATRPVDVSSRGKELFDTAAYKAAPKGNGAAAKSVAKDGGLVSEDVSSPRGFRDEKAIVVLLTSKGNGDSCAQSIIAARDLAFRSNRVHFRVVEESSVIHDETCLQIYCDQRPRDCKALLQSKRMRLMRRDISGALGASVALNLVEGMVEKDTFQNDFYLSVDANIVFTKHWDLELLKQWYSIGNERAILSVSPPSVETRGLNKGIFLLQCSARIHSKDKDAVVEFNPPELKLLTTVQGNGAAPLHFPVLQSQYSERFHFGRVEALLEVRSDPHLSHLVVGHEFMRATRFWTRGYDFYTLSEDIFYYRYESPLAPDEKGKSDEQIQRSSRRVRALLGLPVSQEGEPLEEADKYRPGVLRSLNDWRVFSSIVPDDKFNESTTNHFVNCGHRLHYKHFTLPTAKAK